MVGYGDNIGSGFQKILAAWRTLHLPTPDLREQPDVQEVWLTVRLKEENNSQVKFQTDTKDERTDNQQIDSARTYSDIEFSHANSHAKSHVNLSAVQRDILRYMIENPKSTIEDIAIALKIKPQAMRYQRRLMATTVKTEKIGSDKKGTWSIIFLNNGN